jgi:GntR family transcriptional regulator
MATRDVILSEHQQQSLEALVRSGRYQGAKLKALKQAARQGMDTPIQFQIHTGSAEPIYRQLMDQLRRRVAAGQWRAGQELPSVRELALELAVHPMTISKAYSMLETEGLLQRRRGLPMVIAAWPRPTGGRAPAHRPAAPHAGPRRRRGA